jgi:phage terminase large subunit-like protein
MGGNRSGKTTAGVVEDLWWLTGEHPYLDIRPPVYGRIAAQDLKVLKKVVIRKIEEWVPQNLISARLRGQYGFIQQYEFTNGSILDLMSYEMDVDKFEGVDLDFAHFDEPPPEAIYNATRARLIDRNGHVWFTLTPLKEPWLYDKVYLRAQDNPKKYHIVEVDMTDNPYLSRAGITSFEEDMDEEERRLRVHGEFAHLSGRVIKNFNKYDPYVIESRRIPLHWERFMGIDPHEQKPIASVWVARNDEGQLEVYDELYDPTVDTTSAFVERIHEMEGKAKPEIRVIDNSSNKKDRTSGLSFREDIALEGIFTTVSDKTDRSSRIIDMKGRFKLNPESGKPEIVVQEHCVMLIREIMNWTWEKIPSRSQHLKSASGKTVKKDDDLIDCLLYICSKVPRNGIQRPEPTYTGFRGQNQYDDGFNDRDDDSNDRDMYGGGRVYPIRGDGMRGSRYVSRFERSRKGA